MFQPTPPSPAASMDSFMLKSQVTCTDGNGSSQGQVPADPSNGLVPDWQTQWPHGSLAYGITCAVLAQHPAYVNHGQNVLFPLYPPSIGWTCDVYGRPIDTSALALFTPETSPPAQSEASRQGSVAPPRSQANGLRASVRATKQSARDRRANRKSREQKRRDTSRLFGKSLSQLAVENPHVVVPDPEAFANRPVDIRREEAAGVGKIKRPLNAFMLYRRCYQNVAKTRCLRNNHQQVSTVCGDSWKFHESDNVIDRFNRLAIVEKEMHEQAFPDYKYDPVPNKKAGDGDRFSAAAGSGDVICGGRQRSARRNARKRAAKTTSCPSQPSRTGHDESSRGPADADMTILGSDAAFDVYDLPSLNRSSETPLTSPFSPDICMDDQTVFQAVDAEAFTMTTQAIQYDAVDSSLFFVDTSYIDTALLVNPFDSQSMAIPPSMPDGFGLGYPGCQDQGIKLEHDSYLPDIDAGEAHEAYLRGTEEEWEVQQLSEETCFKDWISQGHGPMQWA